MKQLSQLKIKKSIRRTWGNTNPATKVIASKKIYNRKKLKIDEY